MAWQDELHAVNRVSSGRCDMEFVVFCHATIEHALADYQQRYGKEPRAIIVHPKGQITVPGGISVEHNGGCLANEIWMPAPEDIHHG